MRQTREVSQKVNDWGGGKIQNNQNCDSGNEKILYDFGVI